MTRIDADDLIGKSPMSQKSPGLIPLIFGHAINVASYLRPVNDYRQLRVEVLEDRRMLAVLTVNSPLDNVTASDNLVTLREAIEAADLIDAAIALLLGRQTLASESNVLLAAETKQPLESRNVTIFNMHDFASPAVAFSIHSSSHRRSTDTHDPDDPRFTNETIDKVFLRWAPTDQLLKTSMRG